MNVRTVKTGDTSLYIEGCTVKKEQRGRFMSDEAYKEVLDNTIFVCTDVVIVNLKNPVFYLAKRVINPMQGIFWIGGRRKKGEAPLEGIQRNFRRETGLDLSADKFKFVTFVEYIWQIREQEPQDNGSQNVAHQFMIELTDEELNAIELSPDEYDFEFGLQKFNRNRLEKDNVHPVILDVFDKIFQIQT
ncbi:MAG: NUDIX hydrolase [Candidatus Pacebacteria bacterium]|nr:NUDIX hydrolase [Candidatus Paceibacterota bacterium]